MNPVCDLSTHLGFDVFDKSLDKQFTFSQQQEFGTIDEYLSPYHLPMPHRPITDLLFCVDAQSPLKYHSRKMICKLRDIYQEDALYAFYREFPA